MIVLYNPIKNLFMLGNFKYAPVRLISDLKLSHFFRNALEIFFENILTFKWRFSVTKDKAIWMLSSWVEPFLTSKKGRTGKGGKVILMLLYIFYSIKTRTTLTLWSMSCYSSSI